MEQAVEAHACTGHRCQLLCPGQEEKRGGGNERGGGREWEGGTTYTGRCKGAPAVQPWLVAGIGFIYIYIYTQTHTHTHTHIYIYIYIYTHTHTCTYTVVSKSLRPPSFLRGKSLYYQQTILKSYRSVLQYVYWYKTSKNK